MPLHTKRIKCLIVEDDKFKLDSVRIHLLETLSEPIEISTSEARSTAMSILNSEEFNIVIIDMSIPSHPRSAGAGSPYSLPNGGLDILFEIDTLGHHSTCVILTQYPEIEIEGELVSIALAAEAIHKKFGIKIAGCIQYFEDSSLWKSEMNKILRES